MVFYILSCLVEIKWNDFEYIYLWDLVLWSSRNFTTMTRCNDFSLSLRSKRKPLNISMKNKKMLTHHFYFSKSNARNKRRKEKKKHLAGILIFFAITSSFTMCCRFGKNVQHARASWFLIHVVMAKSAPKSRLNYNDMLLCIRCNFTSSNFYPRV